LEKLYRNKEEVKAATDIATLRKQRDFTE
jgi:hypothetical protein